MSFSEEHLKYIRRKKRKKLLILIAQILIFVSFLIVWEILAITGKINTFLISSPSSIFKTIISLFNSNNLFNHIGITIYETLISFVLSILIGIIIASLLWWNNFVYKIFDPYLTILNSLPKVALGPILIIWIGANTNSIVAMALLISSIISIMNIYNGFSDTDLDKIRLMKSFNASKYQIYKLLILRGNVTTIISSLKINISMCLIGTKDI